jgi:hypothetical protein
MQARQHVFAQTQQSERVVTPLNLKFPYHLCREISRVKSIKGKHAAGQISRLGPHLRHFIEIVNRAQCDMSHPMDY